MNSYRLVARFSSPELARESASELEVGRLVGDEPTVVLHDNVVVVHHHHFRDFAGLVAYFKNRGASVDDQRASSIYVTVLFSTSDDALQEALSIMFNLFVPADPDDQQIDELLTPWRTDHRVEGSVAWVHDPGIVAFHVPIAPADLAHLKDWLAECRVERPVIRIEELSDLALLRAIARARCSACDGTLEYLDPRVHDIETPQLVCKPCGGFYDLKAFLP